MIKGYNFKEIPEMERASSIRKKGQEEADRGRLGKGGLVIKFLHAYPNIKTRNYYMICECLCIYTIYTREI